MAVQKTKQQKRAEFALNSLEGFKGSVPKTHAQFIVGVPTMILTNGLGQTLAFLKAKSEKKEERKFVYDKIKLYLKENYTVFASSADDVAFLKTLNTVPQGDYIKMQKEVLLVLEWLKRYARAFEAAEKKENM